MTLEVMCNFMPVCAYSSAKGEFAASDCDKSAHRNSCKDTEMHACYSNRNRIQYVMQVKIEVRLRTQEGA
jgi:hypothetical protein